MNTWRDKLERYEEFLKSIPVEKYEHLRAIKTVEQDLPRELLPLEIFYKFYWYGENFADYEEVFCVYWEEKLRFIHKFIEKYFYGCSLRFVKEGFKARLYRTWMSILTQFHFQYLWNAEFPEIPLYSDHEMDSDGIDAVVEYSSVKVALQIKKVSYRREASSRRFTKRQRKLADVIAEVPYIVEDPEVLKEKIKRARKEGTRERYRLLLEYFQMYFHRLPNGFVIFKSEYVYHVRKVLQEALQTHELPEKLPYNRFLPM